MAALGDPPDNVPLGQRGYNAEALARAPAIQGPYPWRKATRYSGKTSLE